MSQRAVVAMILGLVLALAGVAPVGAAGDASQTVVVPGTSPGITIRKTDAGHERRVTVPGLAALRTATTPAQARAALVAHMQDVTASASGTASGTASAGIEDFFPVGDLTGDRRRDLVLVRDASAGVRYTAVRGHDASRLWSVNVATTPEHFTRVQPLRGDAKGVLLMTVGFEESAESNAVWSFRLTTDLTAVAPDGAVRWTRAYEGTVTFTDAGLVVAGVAFPVGLGRVNGRGDDIVVRSENAAFSLVGAAITRLEVVDGATGAVTAAVQTAAPEEAGAGLVGDLDGDGLRDLVTTSSAGGAVTAVAYRGLDGRPLWRNSFDGAPVVFAESLGRADADRADDILFTGFDWEADRPIVVTAASGMDGTRRWQRHTEGALVMRDVSGDGLSDVLVLGAVFSSRRLGFRYRALTGAAGTTIYNRAYSVQTSRGSWFGSMSLGPAGDVDADGNTDLAHEISVYGFGAGSRAEEGGVVLARNGQKAFSGKPGFPLGASLDGRGDDFVKLRRTDRGVRVVAVDGRTGTTLWRRDVALGRYRYAYASGADLTGDRRAEVLLFTAGRYGAVLRALDGASQRVRWAR